MNSVSNVLDNFSNIEEKFNKLSEKEKDKQLDAFMESIPILYNTIHNFFCIDIHKFIFTKSIQDFGITKELKGIVNLFYITGNISIFMMKKALQSIEDDNMYENDNEFDNETKQIFINVLKNTEELQDIIKHIKLSQDITDTTELQEKIMITLTSWNIFYKRIIEAEELTNQSLTNLVSSVDDAFSILEKIQQTNL
jgi:hypothetical protein